MKNLKGSKNSLTIALVGCGSVGVSFLFQLHRFRDTFNKIEIFLFNPKNDLASGYAYTTTNDDFLLNADNLEMSICPDDKHHFINWLKSKNLYLENQLSSRTTFGNYLKENLESLLRQSGNDFQINHIDEKVEDCWVESDTEFCVKTATQSFNFNVGIFNHGAIQNTFPTNIKLHDHFIDNFYINPHLLERMSDDSKILLLGSSLTMVDASLLLKNSNKKFNITNASRSGYFPATIFHTMGRSKPLLLNIPVNDISELMLFINLNLSYLLNRWFDINIEILKYEISNKCHIDINYYHEYSLDTDTIYQFALELDLVMDSLYPKLALNQIDVFHKIEKYFGRFLSGIPKINFEKLKNFWRNSSFNIQRLESLKPGKTTFKAKFQNANDYDEFDYVINCSGLRGIYYTNNDNILSHNVIKNNQFKINQHSGLQTHLQTGNVIARNSAHSIITNAYAIGEAKIGSRRMCCDYAFHVRDTKQVVDAILKQKSFIPLHN